MLLRAFPYGSRYTLYLFCLIRTKKDAAAIANATQEIGFFTQNNTLGKVMKKYQWKAFFHISIIFLLLTACEDKRDTNGTLLFENLESESKNSPVFFKGEKYTGSIVKYNEDGTLVFQGSYKEGLKDGVWKYYHPNGKLKREESNPPSSNEKYIVKTYRSTTGRLFTELIGKGEDTIHYKKYHHNGILGVELKNDGQRIFQKWTSFGNLYHYDNQDSIAYTINTKTKEYTYKGRFENGKKTGFWFKHYSNGNKEYEKNYQSGKLVGKSIDYFANGKISKEANYNQNGILEGDYKQYHKNGSIFMIGKYDHKGRRTNTWKYYTEKGKLLTIKNYLFDKLNGYFEDYSYRGKIREKGHYLNNRKVGEWYYYDKYGKFLRKVNEDE